MQLGQEALRIIGLIDVEATRIGAVVAQCAVDMEGGVNATDAAQIITRLTTVNTALTALGHNPENPIPTPIPDPTPIP